MVLIDSSSGVDDWIAGSTAGVLDDSEPFGFDRLVYLRFGFASFFTTLITGDISIEFSFPGLPLSMPFPTDSPAIDELDMIEFFEELSHQYSSSLLRILLSASEAPE